MSPATKKLFVRLLVSAALLAAIGVVYRDLAGAGLTNWDDDRFILATGTAAHWLSELDRATSDRFAYQQLVDEVAATQCRTCGNALVLVGLSAWPQSDPELLASARQALAQRSWSHARIYLAQVRDRRLPELTAIEHELRATPTPADEPSDQTRSNSAAPP